MYSYNIPSDERGVKPCDGICADNPFVPESGSSQFRIPALVTMGDGTVVAAADARWNTHADGCGLDTIVSVSDDDGKTWRYTFANYLGDNGNRMNRLSTTFIDPMLTVRGDTIYLMVDLFPGGVALNSTKYRPEPSTGYNEDGKLLLRYYDSPAYDYYLGDFGEDGFAQIYRKDGTAIAGYTADRWFNLYYKGREFSNLFYYTSPYRTASTSFLYLTTSRDKGKTWSAPQILNPQVKQAHEPFYGTAPGRGTVTESGRLLFPCYYYIYGVQGASFIFSDDGVNWKRTPTIGNVSSEHQLTELSDGTIRSIFRNPLGRICYADAKPDGDNYVWGDIVETDILLNGRSSNCMISSLKYSGKVNGCDVILVACPANGGDRTDLGGRYNGVLRAALYDPETGKTTWKKLCEICGNDDFYGYSCLTELSDGTAALLYESCCDVNFTYTTFHIDL